MPDKKDGPKDPKKFQARLDQGLSDPSVPSFYFNGFVISQSSADLLVIGEQNKRPAVRFNMSFTTAKTLAQALATAITNLEEKMGREIMTTHDINEKMRDENDETEH